MKFLLRMFTWWNSTQTTGVRLMTAKGTKVGEDAEGNVYYQNKDGSRRWVVYNGEIDASRIPPEWHGWIHFTWDEPPTKAPLTRKAWELPHLDNRTGTPAAYVPPGSIRRADPVVRSDYEAWQPE